eukprot:GHVQ01004878.1.p1 GENE.GHVQ01004878.1~~GHVQ01004878.1.p1  ORF type:complete len:252 (+),score=31.13 GHVQ01004878.1:110-865(+)
MNQRKAGMGLLLSRLVSGSKDPSVTSVSFCLAPSYERKKYRKPTGFTKFNFKDQDLSNHNDDEDPEAAPKPLRAESESEQRGGPKVPKAALRETEDEPSRTVPQASGKSPKRASCRQQDTANSDDRPMKLRPQRIANTATSPIQAYSSQQSQRANGSDSVDQTASAFSCLRICGTDAHEVVIAGEPPLRRGSSVGIGTVVDIDDPEADHHWHDQPRHEDRVTRISKRRPTGYHTSMMPLPYPGSHDGDETG